MLENGSEVILPSIVTKVPALLLPSHGNRILYGGEIMTYLQSSESQANQIHDDPEPFHLSSNIYDNICSDNYSFLDTSFDDLTAKGNGGVRQMHNYVSLNNNPLISTPQDDYVPDKIGARGEDQLEKYIEERDKGVPKKQMPFSF